MHADLWPEDAYIMTYNPERLCNSREILCSWSVDSKESPVLYMQPNPFLELPQMVAFVFQIVLRFTIQDSKKKKWK